MKIVVSGNACTAKGDFEGQSGGLAVALEGRKTWIAHNCVRFLNTPHNLSVFASFFPHRRVETEEGHPYQVGSYQTDLSGPVASSPSPAFRLPPRDYQLENFERFKNKLQWAIFSVQGTGKTKVAWDIISHRWLSRMITGVIVLSSPKGVHAQWIDPQMKRHLWKGVEVQEHIWDGKAPKWLGQPPKGLQIISGNVDMVKGKGHDVLLHFASIHKDKLLIIIDESDTIKNFRSQRSMIIRKIAALTQQRAIMTGTPIAKNLIDEWAQFYFLNPAIIGHQYVSSFRSKYCIMGGFENKQIVGTRNLDEFKKLTAPHIFRATKESLSLPPKVYDELVFDLTKYQKGLIKEIKQNFFAEIAKDASITVKSGGVAVTKIQQISNGFLYDDTGKAHRFENPRLYALKELARSIIGPKIVWCRFKDDIKLLSEELENHVIISGEVKQADREKAKDDFMSGKVEWLIATAEAAGRGIDGLQHSCSNAVYYSNSRNPIARWQSEDRIDRIGMNGSASFFDLIARGGIDRRILDLIRSYKEFGDRALDFRDIIGAIE